MLKVEKYQGIDNGPKNFIILTKECLNDPDFNNKKYKWLISKSDISIRYIQDNNKNAAVIFKDKTYVLGISDDGYRITYCDIYERFSKKYRRISDMPPVSPEFTCRRPMTSEELQNADISIYEVDTILPDIGKPITVFKLREYYHTVSERGNLYYAIGRKTEDDIRYMNPCEITPYSGVVSAIWTVRIEMVTNYVDCNHYDASLAGYRSTSQVYRAIICRNGEAFYAFRSGTDINICFQKAMSYIKEFNEDYIWGSFNDINWKEKMIGRHVQFKPMPELDLVVESFIHSQLCVILTLPDGTDPTYRDAYTGELVTDSIKIHYNSNNLDWFVNRNIAE